MIYLMRHGESVVNVERRLMCSEHDGDLTERGREQVAKAALWLADKGITLVRHSPFHRAQQSAEMIGAALDVPVSADPDLCEMHCGDLHGRSDEEAWRIFVDVFMRWKRGDLDARYPGGESCIEGKMRLKRALASSPHDSVSLLVSHGGIVESIVPYLCVNAAALQNTGEFFQTAFAVLEHYDEVDGGRYNCLSWNLHDHLL